MVEKKKDYTKGMEDIERTFDHLDAKMKKEKRQEWYRKYVESKRKPIGSNGKDTLSSKEGDKPTKKEE